MKRGHWIALKNKYLPAILVLVLLFISCIVRGQATYRPSNTGYFTPSNKPFSPATAIPTDGRTYKADTVNGLFRPYNGTSEVLSYLPSGSQWRVGQFPVVINVGGSLQSNGLFIGGQIQVWWFLRGQADSNLVRMDSTGSGTCTTCLLKANNLSDVQSLFQTLINLNLNNVDNTSDATKNSATATITNKTISGLNNTFSNIPNSALVNNSIGLTLNNSGSSPAVSTTPAALGTSLVLSIPFASGSNSGFLSNTFFTSFLGKVDSTSQSNDTVYDWHNGSATFRYVIVGGSGGIALLNGLSASTQTFATGTSGSDFNIVSAVSTHTFNFPNSSASNRGLLTSTDWSTFAAKQNAITPSNTIDQYWNGFENFVNLNTDSVTEGTNHQFYTDARARAAISITTSGSSGPATYNNSTGVLNVPNYTGGSGTDTTTLVLPSLTRSTAGTIITLGLNVANANTWTALQTYNNNIALASNITFGTDNTYAIGTPTVGANAIYSRNVESDGILGLLTTASNPIIFAPNSVTKMTLLASGQLQLNGYTTSTSFTGTPNAFLQSDASGDIIQTAVSSIQTSLSNIPSGGFPLFNANSSAIREVFAGTNTTIDSTTNPGGYTINSSGGAGVGTFQQVLTAGNSLSKKDTIAINNQSLYFEGPGTTIFDSTNYKNIVNFASPATYSAFGDSYTVGVGATVYDSSYTPIISRYINLPETNYGVSGTGVYQAISSHNANIQPSSNAFVTVNAGFNDYRYAGFLMRSRTTRKMANAHNAIFLNQFSKTQWATGVVNANVTFYGSWPATFTPSTVGGKFATGRVSTAVNDSVVVSVTDSSWGFALIGSDSINYHYATFDIYIDNSLLGHYSADAQTDSLTVAGQANSRSPMAFFGKVAYGTHKIKVVNTSTNVLAIDYFAVLKDVSKSTPLVVFEAARMNATGYTVAPANASTTIINAYNASLDSTIALWPAGYPVFIAKTNNFYTPGAATYSDSVHPNNLGHSEIAQAGEAAFVLPTGSDGTEFRWASHLWAIFGGTAYQLDRQPFSGAPGAVGSVLFTGSSSTLNASNALYWSGLKLGVGRNNPNANVDIIGSSPELRISDTTATNAGFMSSNGNFTQITANIDPVAGTFVNTAKAGSRIVLQGNTSAGNIQFYSSATNNTTTQNMTLYGNGHLTLGSLNTSDDGVAQFQVSSGSLPQLELRYNSSNAANFQVNSASTLAINGFTSLTLPSAGIPIGSSSDTVLGIETVAGVSTVKKFTVSGGSSQTLQQVLTTGSTLTGTNNVTNTGQTFTWTNGGTGLWKYSGLSHDTTASFGLLGFANDSSVRAFSWAAVAAKVSPLLPLFTINTHNGLYASGGDSIGLGTNPLDQNTTINTAGFNFLIEGSLNVNASTSTAIVGPALTINGNVSATTSTSVRGYWINVPRANTFTEGSSGTLAQGETVFLGDETFAAGSATTYTDAATLFINGPPAAGANVTITNPWAIYVFAGNMFIGGNIVTTTYNTVSTTHILGNNLTGGGSAPSITAGAGAGTSPTVSLSGDDMSGTITVTTGTLPTGSATVATITYGLAFPNNSYASLYPANAVTAALGSLMVYTTGSTTNFTLTAPSAGLAAATTYKWVYRVGGN